MGWRRVALPAWPERPGPRLFCLRRRDASPPRCRAWPACRVTRSRFARTPSPGCSAVPRALCDGSTRLPGARRRAGHPPGPVRCADADVLRRRASVQMPSTAPAPLPPGPCHGQPQRAGYWGSASRPVDTACAAWCDRPFDLPCTRSSGLPECLARQQPPHGSPDGAMQNQHASSPGRVTPAPRGLVRATRPAPLNLIAVVWPWQAS